MQGTLILCQVLMKSAQPKGYRKYVDNVTADQKPWHPYWMEYSNTRQQLKPYWEYL